MLIKCIRMVSSADSQWCFAAGYGLFDGQHPVENPLIVQVNAPENLPALKSACEEYGIIVESE